MITDQQLSERIWQFFDTIFGPDKTQFGFNADSNLAFFEDRQNNAIRAAGSTALFYRIEDYDKAGNPISSDSQNYDRLTNKEEVITMRKVMVIMNILAKRKGDAQSAHNAFLAYMQSTRRESACYDNPFPFVLVNVEKEQNLSDLEEGAWVERIQKVLHFRYNDKVVIGDIQFTQPVTELEDVKEVVQYDITLKL